MGAEHQLGSTQMKIEEKESSFILNFFVDKNSEPVLKKVDEKFLCQIIKVIQENK